MKNREMVIEGLGMKCISFTDSGLPSVEITCLQQLCGDPKNEKYGKAYDHFKY